MQAECSADRFGFAPVEGHAVVAAFAGGSMTSDGGALLLGATDRQIRLVERFAGCFTDHRTADLVEHTVASLVGQRVFGLALGYEDLVDSRPGAGPPHTDRRSPRQNRPVKPSDGGRGSSLTLHRLQLTDQVAQPVVLPGQLIALFDQSPLLGRLGIALHPGGQHQGAPRGNVLGKGVLCRHDPDYRPQP